jgi:hypothetical protein
MGFSNLTPPHFTSKVALVLADLVRIARGVCHIAAAGYAVRGVGMDTDALRRMWIEAGDGIRSISCSN